jgi:magnesium transporter
MWRFLVMLRQLSIVDGKLAENGPTGEIFVYVNPDESERRHLIDAYGLDEHTLASSLDPDELSRIEFEPEHVAIIFKRPKDYSSAEEFLFKVSSTGFFLFKDRLILIVPDDAPLFEGKPFARVSSLKDVALKLMYRSTFHFLEHLKIINATSTSLEQKINSSMENRYLLNMFTLEKSLVYYLNAINSNGKAVERLKANAARLELTPEQVEFVDDMLIENTQCYEQAEIYSNILAGLMDARASIVSNNLNGLLKTLTLITIGIMLPTLVVGMFSMNVEMPLQHHPYAFWMIMGLAVCSVLGLFAYWRYK